MKKTAVLLATYNGEKYISRQLSSIAGQQGASEFSVYVHDDGSTDGTVRALEDFRDSVWREAPREGTEAGTAGRGEFVILEGPPTGSSRDNFFYLVNNVSADYYFFSDQDDEWEPHKMARCEAAMAAEEERVGADRPILVFSDGKVISEEGRELAESLCRYQSFDPRRTDCRRLIIRNVVTGCSVMINDKCAEYMRRVDGDLYSGIVMHDWWAALIAARFGRIVYIDEPLVRYRQHADNVQGARVVGSPRYLREKLPGGGIAASLREKEEQTELFLRVYHQRREGNEVEYEFARLHSRPKPARLRFYFRHRVFKSGFLRNVGLVLFG
ncbi:MAG: glycosyltransferase family 2 protein [Eubacterium sp.]|nr:glycosyltransferase family 2 protein [Eubacterium sp.]